MHGHENHLSNGNKKKGGAGGFREIMEKKTICQAQKMTKHDKGTIKFVHMTCVLYTS